MLLPVVMAPPARPDGAAAVVGRPNGAGFVAAMAVACVVAGALSAASGGGILGPAAGMAVGLCLALAMTLWAVRSIGGHTGDIAGACQQLAEIGFYLGVLAVVSGTRG
jgi:adenosylcobinamide-GDP ribazoletransferase